MLVFLSKVTKSTYFLCCLAAKKKRAVKVITMKNSRKSTCWSIWVFFCPDWIFIFIFLSCLAHGFCYSLWPNKTADTKTLMSLYWHVTSCKNLFFSLSVEFGFQWPQAYQDRLIMWIQKPSSRGTWLLEPACKVTTLDLSQALRSSACKSLFLFCQCWIWIPMALVLVVLLPLLRWWKSTQHWQYCLQPMA